MSFPRLKIERRRERRRLRPRWGAEKASMDMIDMGRERGGPETVSGRPLAMLPSMKKVERRLSFAAALLGSARL